MKKGRKEIKQKKKHKLNLTLILILEKVLAK
jgi:hypothetical protein